MKETMLVTLAGTKGSTIVVKDFKTLLIKINEILDTVCGRLTIVLRVKNSSSNIHKQIRMD